MKTLVIRLETYDDVTSIRDKIGWAKSGRVLLVWPERLGQASHLPERRVEMALIAHAASSLGLALAISTGRADVRTLARETGIPVFPSIRQAQSARWRALKSRTGRLWRQTEHHTNLAELRAQLRTESKGQSVKNGWRQSFIFRGIVFSLAMLVILSLALVSVPEARIGVRPQQQTQEISFPVQANPAAERINLAGELPTYTASVIVETSAVIATTGAITVPVGQATGAVRFTNLTNHTVTIPEDTIVRTEGEAPVRYAVTQSGSLPGRAGATLNLPVRALEPGTRGNVSSGKVLIVEGDLGFQATVKNLTPIQGGMETTVAAPDPADRIRLYNQAIQKLRQIAGQELADTLPLGDLMVSTATLTATLEQTYLPEQIIASEQLSLTLRLQFEALAVRAADIESLATSVLDIRIPEGYTAVPGTLTVKNQADSLSPLNSDETDGEDRTMHWTIQAERQVIARLSEDEIISLVRGQNPMQAAQRLSVLPLAAPPAFLVTPAWWPRLPLLPMRIQVHTETTLTP